MMALIKRTIAKLIVAAFTLAFMVPIGMATTAHVADGRIGFLVLVIVPILALISILFTRGTIRALGTGMIWLGMTLSIIPVISRTVLQNFQGALETELRTSGNDQTSTGELFQQGADIMVSSFFWFGVLVGAFLIFAGYMTLTKADRYKNHNTKGTGWILGGNE